MSMRFLLQMSLLLIIGQVLTGALSLGLSSAGIPWLGLPLLLLLLWLVRRTGQVLREELDKAKRRKADVVPERIALFVGLLWQAPGLLALLPGLKGWAPPLWNGAVLTIPHTLGLWTPTAGHYADLVLAWTAWLALVGFFLWATLRQEQVQLVTALQPVVNRSGEWAPARTRAEVQQARGRKVAAAQMEPEEPKE